MYCELVENHTLTVKTRLYGRWRALRAVTCSCCSCFQNVLQLRRNIYLLFLPSSTSSISLSLSFNLSNYPSISILHTHTLQCLCKMPPRTLILTLCKNSTSNQISTNIAEMLLLHCHLIHTLQYLMKMPLRTSILTLCKNSTSNQILTKLLKYYFCIVVWFKSNNLNFMKAQCLCVISKRL